MNHKINKYQKRIIHNSVLIGFGEVSTFAGALFGVDYKYKEKRNY